MSKAQEWVAVREIQNRGRRELWHQKPSDGRAQTQADRTMNYQMLISFFFFFFLINRTNIGGGARPQKSKDGVKFWSQISGPQSLRVVYPPPILGLKKIKDRMGPIEGKPNPRPWESVTGVSISLHCLP